MEINVKKRDGRTVKFDISKIQNAIKKAFDATGKEYDDSIISLLALKATSNFSGKIRDGEIGVEEIQDSVEKTLSESGYSGVAKNYILYRESHRQVRAINDDVRSFGEKLVEGSMGTVDDATELCDPCKEMDVIHNQNASTAGGTVGAAILQESETITKMFWENHYDPEIRKMCQVDGGNGEIYIHDMGFAGGYCFTGDTRIKTLDGKRRTFKELVDSGTKEVWVFAYDAVRGEIVPALATNPRITRHNVVSLAEVELDNGKTIRCTPDHKFLLRDGAYAAAKDLKTGTSIMPLYLTDDEKFHYVQIEGTWMRPGYDGRKRNYLHRWVAECTLGRTLEKSECVHHLNGDKHDNRPENLEVMPSAKHRAMELGRTVHTDVWKEANNLRVVAYNKSKEKRAMVSEHANQAVRDDHGRFTYVGEPNGPQYNHKVKEVNIVELENPVDVYDITVEKYHNFALDAGVFVHNCAGWSLKDLIIKGLGGVPNKISSSPAKHLATLCNQLVNFLGIMQNEWAGAQAVSSFDTYLAPFIKADNLTYDQTKQAIQSFVYGINVSSRWGSDKCLFA